MTLSGPSSWKVRRASRPGRPIAQSRSTERRASFTISRRTTRRTAREPGGRPDGGEGRRPAPAASPGGAPTRAWPPMTAKVSATGMGRRPPTAAARSITRANRRAARGPWPNGASGRGGRPGRVPGRRPTRSVPQAVTSSDQAPTLPLDAIHRHLAESGPATGRTGPAPVARRAMLPAGARRGRATGAWEEPWISASPAR